MGGADFSGCTINITADLDMGAYLWRLNIPGNKFKDGVLDGNGHTIHNLLNVRNLSGGTGGYGYGFIGDSGDSFTIQNITFQNASVGTPQSGNVVGVVLGYVDYTVTLRNVHVTDSEAKGFGKVGGLAGMVGTDGVTERTARLILENCSVTNTTVDGYYNLGGLAGLVQGYISIDEQTSVTNVTPVYRGGYEELHTITNDTDNQKKIEPGNVITDGKYWYTDGYMFGAYADFCTYTGGAYLVYEGYNGSPYYGKTGLLAVQPGPELVSRDNYDYGAKAIKNSVIYYGVYRYESTARDVLFGYEYVADGENITGTMLYNPAGDGELKLPEGVAWYTDEACTTPFDKSAAISGNTVLYTPIALVTNIDPEMSDGALAAPADGQTMPTVTYREEGRTFCGWYANPDFTGSKVEKPGHIPDTALTLYAWDSRYCVTFVNGEEITEVFVAPEARVNQPGDPENPNPDESLSFIGWYTDAECTAEYSFDAPVTENLTLYAGWTEPDIVITPVDMIVYQGGQDGYYAVVGADGQTTLNDTTLLPYPAYEVELSDALKERITVETHLFIRAHDENDARSWTFVPYGALNDDGSYSGNLYRIIPEDGNTENSFNIHFEDGDGNRQTNDWIDDPTAARQEYRVVIDLPAVQNSDFDMVVAVGENETVYPAVAFGAALVSVRNLTNYEWVGEDTPDDDSGAVSAIADAAPQTRLSSALAVEKPGTVYYFNGNENVILDLTPGELGIRPASIPSLLFDDLLQTQTGGAAYGGALKQRVDETLGEAPASRRYEGKYLNLVDAANSNAWIVASQPVEIYWPYPEGTDSSTEFTLLHFKDVNRGVGGFGGDADMEAAILAGEIERIAVTNTDAGIRFETNSFSPFVLVWNEADPGDVTPPTGDSGSMALWLTLMAVSALGLGVALLCGRKRKAAR